MSPLRGPLIEDPELERSYRARFLAGDQRRAVVVLVLMSACLLPAVFNDARFVTDPDLLLAMYVARAAGVVLTAGICWFAFHTKRPAVLDTLVVGWVAIIAASNVVVQATRPADYLLPVAIEAAFVITTWALLPNQFSLQALAGALVTLEGVTWLALTRRPLEPAERLVISMTLLASNVIGAAMSWEQHRLRRRLFLEHRKLEASEAEVSRLSKLLPVCMYCKKIRDEAGQWQTMERYFTERTDSQFSHGMCDDCFHEHEHD